MARVLVCDDAAFIRMSLIKVLKEAGHEPVGEAGNGVEAFKKYVDLHPDVVLMDIRMKECDGVIGTRLIKEQFTKIKVIILTTFKDKEYIQDALKYGAFGYMLKDSSHDVIYEGIYRRS